jgi:hypothetical protein
LFRPGAFMKGWLPNLGRVGNWTARLDQQAGGLLR